MATYCLGCGRLWRIACTCDLTFAEKLSGSFQVKVGGPAPEPRATETVQPIPDAGDPLDAWKGDERYAMLGDLRDNIEKDGSRPKPPLEPYPFGTRPQGW